MNVVRLNPALGTVRVDVTTDIDHLARYRLFLAEKSGATWKEIPGTIVPPDSNSRDPKDHEVSLPPAKLDGCLIQVAARVNSLVKTPGPLDMNLRVYQDAPLAPSGGAVAVGNVDTYPVDYHTPVPFGQEKRIVVSFVFQTA